MNATRKLSVITGMGVISPIGIGIDRFTAGLKSATTNYHITEFEQQGSWFRYPVAKLNDYNFRDCVTAIQLEEKIINNAKRLRNVSASISTGVYCALEAWANAGLNNTNVDLNRVAIVSAGSNTQQATLHAIQEEYRSKLRFINPNYGMNFFDSDMVGVLSELLGIRGEGHTIGSASASGNMAIIQGHRLLATGDYDVVLVVAPLMDLSIFEYQGFTALGAMAVAGDTTPPAEICRPFDAESAGFVHGQSAGCIILEREEHASGRSKQPYGTIAGYGVCMDADRNPNPSVEGETRAMISALKSAGLDTNELDYVNTHGSSSHIGDKTEADAMILCGLAGVKANSTKSIIGHALSAAGLVEAIATLVQMKHRFLHLNHNLLQPITPDIDWIRETQDADVSYAMNNSFGFGGINTSIIIKKQF